MTNKQSVTMSPKKKQTYTLDLRGQCYDVKSLEEGAKGIEAFIERNISFYPNVDPSPRYKVKVVFEERKDA